MKHIWDAGNCKLHAQIHSKMPQLMLRVTCGCETNIFEVESGGSSLLCWSLRQLIHELSVSINVYFVLRYLHDFLLFHIIVSVLCYHFYPWKSKNEWISLGKRQVNILPDLPLLLTIYVVLVHCISDLPYILQSHCILPVFIYIFVCNGCRYVQQYQEKEKLAHRY